MRHEQTMSIQNTIQNICSKIFRTLENLREVESPNVIPGLCRIEARLFLAILFVMSVCRDIEQFYKLSDGAKLLKMIEEYLNELNGKVPVIECG
jgi:hypothetical protein